jgi:hypothetical protein
VKLTITHQQMELLTEEATVRDRYAYFTPYTGPYVYGGRITLCGVSVSVSDQGKGYAELAAWLEPNGTTVILGHVDEIGDVAGVVHAIMEAEADLLDLIVI